MRNAEINIHTKDSLLAVPVTEKSSRKWVLGGEDTITLYFTLDKCVRLHTGDYVLDEGFGKFYLLSDYMPRYNTSLAGYEYQVVFHNQYWLWKNKIFKYIPEYGGQECSWTLTAKPSVFLEVVLQNLSYYGFHYEDGEGEHEYQFRIKDRIFQDGTVVIYDAKSVTLSFSNTNIIDALGMLAKEVGGEYWVDGDTIWLGWCENFRGEYKTDEHGAEIPRRDEQGNIIYLKDDDGYILVDGEKVPCLDPVTKPVSLEPYEWDGVACPPNAETMSTQDGKANFANRIFVFGGETNIPHYYRKKLIFDKNAVGPVAESGSSVGFYDSFRIITPLDFRSDLYDYAGPSDVRVWTKGAKGELKKSLTFKKNEVADSVIRYSDYNVRDGEYATIVTMYKGIGAFESSDFKCEVTLDKDSAEKIEITIALLEDSHDIASKTLTLTKESAARFYVQSIPYTEFKTACPDDKVNGNYDIEYRLRITGKENFDGTAKANVVISGTGNGYTMRLYNLNPKITTSGNIISGETKTSQTFVLNPNHLPYNSVYARCFQTSSHPAEFQFEVDGLVLGKLRGSYFTNDAKNEVAVNGIVQKRLMLPIDMRNREFDEIKADSTYDGYFVDLGKETGKGQIDGEEELSVNEIIEQVVIDDKIYPNQQEEIEEVVLQTDIETDDDGNETTTYYYMVNGGAFKSFTKDFIITGTTLQITFGDGGEDGGKLNGMTFDAELVRKNGIAWFRVVPNDDYAVTLPNDLLFPSVGDKYAIVNYDPAFVGDTMVYKAEAKLLKAGYDYMKDLKKDKKVYTFGMMSDSMQDMIGQNRFFRLGDLTTLIGAGFEDGHVSRVTSIEQKLDIPYDSPTITCGESSAYSRLGAMEGKIDELQYKGNTYSSVSSQGGGLNVYVIKTGDSTTPSNYNLMSASRTMEEIRKSRQSVVDESDDKFLRKDIDDEAAGNVTFDQTIDVKGNTTLEGDLDARGSVTHGGTTVHQGQTTHNALARFNQDAEIPADSTERVMGTIKFMAPLSDGAETTPQERGYINGNGNAQLQTLDVKGRADLEGVAHIHELISEAVTGQAEDFIDGYDGHGLRIWKEEDAVTGAPMWHITADYLTIRQQMKVFELLIQKIRSTGGTIVVSNANGKVKSVSKSVDNTWRITFETGCDFAVGDIIRCQSWKNMREQGSHVETSAWTGKVYAVQGTGEDAVVIIPDTAEWFSGSTPKEGDECVQWGSTNEARQNIIYITAAEGDNPAVDMLGEVTGPGTGNLHVRIGKLDGIVTGSNTFVPQGWGLYADNAFLKGKFVLENGDDVYQLFVLQNGRLESTISETRALTTGDSIIANPAFLDGFQPWNYYHVTSQLLSDGELILSDGEKLLSGVGDATKYVGLVTEGMRRFVRIVDNESTDPDIGIEQDVTFMRQVDGKKTVELSFEYRIHTSGDVLITLDSYKNGLVGSLSTEKTSDLYGLQSALVKDGEWHTARVYGTYVSGNGSIQVCAKGNVDLSAFQLYEAVGVQSLSTSITQTSEQIALMATKTELNAEIQARTTAVSNLNVKADRIEGVTSKIQFDSNDKITNIDTSGLVTESGYGALFTTNLHNTDGFYDVSYDSQGNPTYTLKLINIQTAQNTARSEILTYRNTQLEQDLTDHDVAKAGDWDGDVNQLRSDTLSTFVSGNEMTAQLSGYYEKDSSGNLVYWTTEDTDYKASDWGNPTSTPTEGKAYFIVAYTKDGVTTHRLAVYDKWKMSDPNNRVVEFVPKFTIKAQISTFLSFKHDANGDPIYARDASGNIIYIDGVPQKEVEGNVMMKADNIIQIAEKIQSVARQMTFTADHIVFNGYVDANGLKIDTEGNVTTFGVVNNGTLTINASNIGNYCTGFSEGSGGSWIDLGGHHFLDVLRCPPTIIINHSSLQSLWLPVAYLRDTDTYTTGQTKFGHDTWQDHTIAEMRSMIGKKLNLYIQDINPQSGVYADLLVEVNRHEVDVVSGFPQQGDTISTAVTKTWMCVPTDTTQGVGIGIGKYLTIECKTGVIDNHECIYWEATHSATSLD